MKKMMLIIILLIFPLFVNAENNYKVIAHYIDSEIEISGNLRVKEIIEIEGDIDYLSRTLNYYSFGNDLWDTKTIDFETGTMYNGTDIYNFKVSAYTVKEDVTFDTLNQENLEFFTELDLKKPQDNTYAKIDNKNGTYTYNINFEAKNKKVVFYLEYLVGNVVVIHKDIAELNYTFQNLTLNSPNTVFRLIIPYALDKEDFHFWVHGNQSGIMDYVNTSDKEVIGVLASFTEIKDSVNFRGFMPLTQVGIDISLNHTNTDAKEKILKVEQERVNNTEKITNIINYAKYVLIGLSSLYVVGSVIIAKITDKRIISLYLIIGALITIFNYIFKAKIIYLYFVIPFYLLTKTIFKYLIKTRKVNKSSKKRD